MGKKTWTEEEIRVLEDGYKNMESIKSIAEKINKTESSIQSKARKLGLCDKYIRYNNPKFKAVYQDYDWCYERYINRGMTHQEMADECGATKRVVEKWCSQIHKLNNHTFRKLKKLNDMQKQIIMFGRLGDGHIDRRQDQPMYIECHAEDEKDYLFWKYSFLKDICNQEPVYYKESYNSFGNEKKYLCKPFYRLNTKILDDLYEIRNMSRIEIISKLNELGFCLHILDDGTRNNLWEVCLAEWSMEEIELYKNTCYEKFGLIGNSNKDIRYFTFNAFSSLKIDQMILNNIPNNLDIVHKKILDNDKIKETANYRFVILEDGTKVGLSTYCKTHYDCDYEKTKEKMRLLDVDRLNYYDLELKGVA